MRDSDAHILLASLGSLSHREVQVEGDREGLFKMWGPE